MISPRPSRPAATALTEHTGAVRIVGYCPAAGFVVAVIPARIEGALWGGDGMEDNRCGAAYLSPQRGRLNFGIGVGYVEPELHAFGVDRSERGTRTDEYLAALRVLWDAPVAWFDGPTVSFSGVVQRPLPTQRPHPLLVIGAQTGRAFVRVIREAHGWYGWALGVEETAEALDGLRAAAREHERPSDLGELEISVTPTEPVDLDTVRRYADLGVHRLVLHPQSVDGNDPDDLTASPPPARR